MIAYKKQRRRVDPVKQILARLDEKQSKLGLSLYSRSSNVCSEKEDGLPVVQPFTEAASTSNKSSGYFHDLSVARQKVHKRLNAGLKHSMTESHHMSQAKVNRQLNQTFPPTKYHETSALVNQRKESYSFGGWSDTPSVGVENIRNSHYTSMNPFGYNRRTLAFQPTSLNYVVEWPETWPLKIMSLNGKGTRRPYKKKEKTKHKVLPKVHFEGSSAPFPSPEVMSKRNKKQATAEAVTAGPEKQVPQSSENTSLSRSSVSDKQKGLAHVEELSSSGRDLLANNCDSDNLLAMEDGKCTENARVHQDMSHCSVGPEDKGIEETENPQAGNTTRPSSVPPCSPTPFARELENETAVKSEGGECSQSHLNDIVSQIAAEPGKDYMQDI